MGIERGRGREKKREQRVVESEKLSRAVWDKQSTLQIVPKSAVMCRSPPPPPAPSRLYWPPLHLISAFPPPPFVWFLLFPHQPGVSLSFTLTSYLHLCFSFSLPLLCPPPPLLLIWQAAILTQCAGEWAEFIFCSCPPLGLMNTVAALCARGG